MPQHQSAYDTQAPIGTILYINPLLISCAEIYVPNQVMMTQEVVENSSQQTKHLSHPRVAAAFLLKDNKLRFYSRVEWIYDCKFPQ